MATGWTDERLNQLAAIVEAQARDTANLRSTVENLAGMVATQSGEMSELRGEMQVFLENLRFLIEASI